DPGEGDFQRDIFPVRGRGHPLETGAAPGHAFLDILASHDIGALAIGLERWRQLTRVFSQQFVRELAAHDAYRGWIDLQQFVLIMENDSVTRTFEEGTELRFRFAQGAFG